MRQEITQESLKAAPPVAVTAIAWMSGLTMNELVGLATLAYIGLQTMYLVWRWWNEFKRRRK